jgi:hypothetical protein
MVPRTITKEEAFAKMEEQHKAKAAADAEARPLSERAGIPLFGPDDARNWSEWSGPIPFVARVAGDHEARISQAVVQLMNDTDREVDFEAAMLRAWKHVLDQGVYCLVLDAGAGEIDKEWILFGKRGE